MGVDLHRIGTGISSGSSRNGFGNIVSFPSVSAPSFPPAGTVLSLAEDLPYPQYNGGSTVTITWDAQPYTVLNQIADFYVKADGAGGSYTDYNTASNVEFVPYGTYINTFNSNLYINIGTSCSGEQGPFSNGSSYTAFNHDGAGSYYSPTGWTNYASYGTIWYNDTCEFDDGMGGTYYVTTYYISDGNGSYTSYT